jgi:hypothetical protein
VKKAPTTWKARPRPSESPRDLPKVQLIFILREPADRAYSNYLWSRMNGIETETLETALALEAERERTLPERWKFARTVFLFFSWTLRGVAPAVLRSVSATANSGRQVRRHQAAPDAAGGEVHRFLGVVERLPMLTVSA